MSPSGVTAVILAGGTSARLGGDKALAEVGGYPLLGRVAAAARTAADEIVVVSGDREAHALALTATGVRQDAVRWAEDARPGRGPLAGIEIGLWEASHDTCLVLACDLPYLRPAPLRALVSRFAEGPPSERPRILVPLGGGRRQPLCSVCDRAAGRVAADCLDDDLRALDDWLGRLDVREVVAADLPGAAPEPDTAWWADLDDLASLTRARAAAAEPAGDAARPDPRLETERLALDAAGPRFARELFEAYGQDPEVTRYLLWEPHQTLRDTLAFLRDTVESWRTGEAYVWVIRERSDDGRPGPLVGMIGLHPDSDHDQVGYALARERWGRGYMTEALGRVLTEATEAVGLDEVRITVHPENAGSIRVLEKAGLEREGTMEDHHVFPNLGGEPADCYVYVYRTEAGG